MISEIIGHGPLSVDSEDGLYEFIRGCTETTRDTFDLLEFVKLEYCLTNILHNFLDLLSEYSSEISASIWATRPSSRNLETVLSVDEGMYFDVPNEMIVHLARECSSNVQYYIDFVGELI
jgi:hypothetical protein